MVRSMSGQVYRSIACLILVLLVLKFTPAVTGAPVELSYDDGTTEINNGLGSQGYGYGIRFSLPSGWAAAKILKAKYYLSVFGMSGTSFEVRILDSDLTDVLLPPLHVDQPSATGWVDVDLSAYGLVVGGDFYVEMYCGKTVATTTPALGTDQTAPHSGRSYSHSLNGWDDNTYDFTNDQDFMIRAEVEETTNPPTTVKYDDGSSDVNIGEGSGSTMAVRFSPPPGWGAAKLLRAQFHIRSGPSPFMIRVMSDRHVDLLTPLQVDPYMIGNRWWCVVDLSSYNLKVSGEYYIVLQILTDFQPAIGRDTSAPIDGRSLDNWSPIGYDLMFRAVVTQVNAEVAAPTNPLCEGQTNPTNLLTLTPTFSWTFDDPDPGATQTKWNIEVTTGPYGTGTLMWLTSQSGTASSVTYAGSTLNTGVTYHWRVKTWDNNNMEGPYCLDQTFKINAAPVSSNLKTEGQTNPSGLTTLKPTFSWAYSDSEGDAQTHWEIEVGTTQDGNDQWDLNDVAGSAASTIYAGTDLNKGSIYYVRVRVKDGHWWGPWAQGTFGIRASGESIQTSTGSGTAYLSSNQGWLTELTAIPEGTLPTNGKPNLFFPHGFFSFKIIGLTSGATVTVTITLPQAVPVGTQFWKYGPTPDNPTSHWYQIPIGDDDGDNVITIPIKDGGVGDDDLTANGQITDQGGPGQQQAPRPVGGIVTASNKLSIIAPYLALAGLAGVLTVVMVVRKKHRD